jgi:hypothetical protein
MLLTDDLLKIGAVVWPALRQHLNLSDTQWTTGYLAMNLRGIADPSDPQAAFKNLRRLAESGFPGAEKGEEREVKRYGKVQKQRPWLWRASADDKPYEEWRTKIQAEPAKVGPYVAIEARLRALEEKIARLEDQASSKS